MSTSFIALNRFGLGARPDESAPSQAADWLLSQMDRFEVLPPGWAACRRTSEQLQLHAEAQQSFRMTSFEDERTKRLAFYQRVHEDYEKAVAARAEAALDTPAPFIERLVHFWTNHFAVSIETIPVMDQAAALEADAIRPNVLGRFEDLLLAAVRHPAMLTYLDQSTSVGPNSVAAVRAAAMPGKRGGGLNENLAREILELHSLGVRAGYTQGDVIELARALTGWTAVASALDKGTPSRYPGFVYRPEIHEPGERVVLGRRYGEQGEQQSIAILRDLAKAPATAMHVATKLARHFVADEPPALLVQKLSDAFLRSGGDLRTVYAQLVAAPEAWAEMPAKFKTPWEWMVSSMRALGVKSVNGKKLAATMAELAQPIWRPGSPAGFDDVASSWASPNALVSRLQVARRFGDDLPGGVDAQKIAPGILPRLHPASAAALSKAGSRSDAVALLLVSPEFLRR